MEILKGSCGEMGAPSSTPHTKESTSVADLDADKFWHEDVSSQNATDDTFDDNASDLDREWQRRRDKFHTFGYCDGLLSGKEASAQEGFNIGFGESVFHGYKWGLVRGVSG